MFAKRSHNAKTNANGKDFRRLAIKVGSNVLTRPDGMLDTDRMAHIVSQIAILMEGGTEVILISSGAVAAGRSVIKKAVVGTDVATRQLCAAVGQAKLMNIYFDLFQAKGLIGGQVLTTKENFFDDVHYYNQKTCMEAMLDNGIIPIVNENDTVTVTELMFTDNDELAGLVAVMMGCSGLLILSNIDGIYTGDPNSPSSEVIAEADDCGDLACFIRAEKSALGRGGMTSKVRIAQETAAKGVSVIIANGTRHNVITDVIASNPNTPRTRFGAHTPKSGEECCSAAGAIEMMGGLPLSPVITSVRTPTGAIPSLLADHYHHNNPLASATSNVSTTSIGTSAPSPTAMADSTAVAEEAERRIDAAVSAAAVLRTAMAKDGALVPDVLAAAADALMGRQEALLAANAEDLARMDSSEPRYDRLKLTAARIARYAGNLRSVAAQPSPVGKVLVEAVQPNGMVIRKVAVPFGVIGVIYEARPKVTLDAFALCLASGNACVLKGGADARSTNTLLGTIIHEVLAAKGLPTAVCTLLQPSREAAMALLHAQGKIDVVIPRGGRGLIDWTRHNAKVPTIETGAGVCHAYIDASASVEDAAAVVTNAKCRGVALCNALDCLLIHEGRLSDLATICGPMSEAGDGHGVTLYADERAYAALEGKYPARLLQRAADGGVVFGTEYLDYKLSIRTVGSLAEATAHIARYGSRHSECIISRDPAVVAEFQSVVDAACVYGNASTAFTGGPTFGFGVEMGISTQKLHVRGPMGLSDLTTYKYLIEGNGHVRI